MSDWCFSPVIDTSKASIHRLYTQTRTFLLKTSPSLTLTPLLVTDLTYLHSKLFHQLRTLTDLSYVHVAGGVSRRPHRCVIPRAEERVGWVVPGGAGASVQPVRHQCCAGGRRERPVIAQRRGTQQRVAPARCTEPGARLPYLPAPVAAVPRHAL
jgi:hypothetical protein